MSCCWAKTTSPAAARVVVRESKFSIIISILSLYCFLVWWYGSRVLIAICFNIWMLAFKLIFHIVIYITFAISEADNASSGDLSCLDICQISNHTLQQRIECLEVSVWCLWWSSCSSYFIGAYRWAQWRLFNCNVFPANRSVSSLWKRCCSSLCWWLGCSFENLSEWQLPTFVDFMQNQGIVI
jgi:hypothetical protein